MAGLTVADSELLQWDGSKTSMQNKLGELVQYFQVGIPSVDGIPRAYIDATQLFPYMLGVETADDLSDAIVANAKTAIDFDDGIPTVGGIPLWERLEGEPVPYYKIFKEYREMKYLSSEGGFSRSIAKVAEATGMPGRQLSALARVYHWSMRVKAYDQFKLVQKEKMRQQAVETLESKHAKVSNQLLDQAVTYLTAHPEQLSPKVAVDLVALAMRSGRLAVGLNPDKPGSDGGGRSGGTNVNIVNQQNAVGENGTLNQVNAMDGLSEVERQTHANAADPTHLQSILHVLNASGAFATAAGQEVDTREYDENDGYIDADYEIIEE